VDKQLIALDQPTTVAFMREIDVREEVNVVNKRMRSLREAKTLTLVDVEQKSRGEITAVALGSYERGDRQVNLLKLLQIARIYEIPAAEMLGEKTQRVEPGRITIDLRKILRSQRPEALAMVAVLRQIAVQRGDWNGEVMSIRATDITNFSTFSGLPADQIQLCIDEFTIARSK
jgi:transcriptional regulator with XRE-family HTH domain